MKYIVYLSILMSFATFSQENDAVVSDSAQVHGVIEQLFEGMRVGDSSMVSETFHEDLQMITTYIDKEGYPGVIKGSAEQFKNAVGTPHDETWIEKISNVEIQIDDNLAQVWMDYSFYIEDKFSHCGVNSIQLVKTVEGWKMIHLADSRRRTNCN